MLNLINHQDRVDRTFRQFYPGFPVPDLALCIQPSNEIAPISKIRFLYNHNQFEYTCTPYEIKPIRSIKSVRSNTIDYAFKYEDRSGLKQLYNQRGSCDDIIIIKDDLVTDTYYANVALFDGKFWYTPDKPLLRGTRRQQLIELGDLKEARIEMNLLRSFEKISLINAMLDLGQIELDVSQIL